MKRSLQVSILFLGVIGLFAGCSEKLDPKPITYSQLLTGTEKKTWRLVTFEVIDQKERSGVIPVQNSMNPCRADDQYVFYADGGHKFEYQNGSTKCTANEGDLLFEDSWALTNGNATLEFVIPVFADAVLPYTIKNLTENSMTVEIYFDKIYADPIDVSYRFTFNSNTR
ncbi:lipocalin family protein [Larkinella arboricola]